MRKTRVLARCKIQTKIDFNRCYIFLGMYLDAFDRRIVDALRVKDKPMTLAELVDATGFARSTVIIHLERLMSEEFILREKNLLLEGVEDPNSSTAS